MATKKTDTNTDTIPENSEPRSPKWRGMAGPCPRNEGHPNTVVYRTAGNIRYCKCNDCGATWKQGPGQGDPIAEQIMEIADTLDQAARIEGEGGKVIIISDDDAQLLSEQLRELVRN